MVDYPPLGDVSAALAPLVAVVYAVLSPQGRVLSCNRGFAKLMDSELAPDAPWQAMLGRDVTDMFLVPPLHDWLQQTAHDGTLRYAGLINLRNPSGATVSLQAQVVQRGENVELLAEHEVQEMAQLMHSVLSLNEELAQTQRDLARANRAQAALLAKLEAAQAQMLQSEKLASIGQLAAGVAHEINNPVAFVSSNFSSLGEYLQDLLAIVDAYASARPVLARDAQALAAVDRVCQERDLSFVREDAQLLLAQSREGLDRVTRIVQDLKDFSRVDQVAWQVADLHAGLDSTLHLVQGQLMAKAEVVRAYGDLPALPCAPGQLNQVFMNLLVNAAQAIEDHGVITVRTGCTPAPSGPPQWGWVEVQDTGCGIAPHQMRRLFEPFYTTKPIGTGTGLGLSLSYGIVQKHGGRIEVESTPGKGSCFRVLLPLQGNPQAPHAVGPPGD